MAFAMLFALAFPPFDLWFLVFLAPVPLTWLAITARSSRRAVAATFIVQVAMWLWLGRWVIPVTPVGYPFFALYMSIWPTLLVWIIRRVARTPTLAPSPLAILLPVLWTGMEYLRGDIVFHGYPWYLLAHPMIAVPALAQSADLFGTYFGSFLVAMVSGWIIDLAWARPHKSTPDRSRVTSRSGASRSRIALHLAVVVLLLGNIAYGAWRLGQTGPLSPGPRVLAIQTSLPQDNKLGWGVEDQARDVPAFMAMTREAARQANPQPDLIVWPETMVPGVGFEVQTLAKLRELHDEYDWDLLNLYRWDVELIHFQRDLSIPLLVGSEAWIDTSETLEGTKIRLSQARIYNSAYLLQGDPPFQRYDKFFLTPFGETMPYISAWPWLERLFLRIGVGADLAFNLDSNSDLALLRLNWSSASGITNGVDLATPICFEDTVARLCRRMIYRGGVKRGELFVNLSNDGWFNTSDADRRLHAQIARFRCIENRVPMVRCVNTGMSVAIDSAGRLIAAVGNGGHGEPRRAGSLLVETRLDSRHTLYSRVGESWPIGCLIVTALALILTWLPRRRTAAS